MGPHHPPDRVATVGNSANLRSFGQPAPGCRGGGHALAAFTANPRDGYGPRRGGGSEAGARPPRLLLSSDLSLNSQTAKKVRSSRDCPLGERYRRCPPSASCSVPGGTCAPARSGPVLPLVGRYHTDLLSTSSRGVRLSSGVPRIRQPRAIAAVGGCSTPDLGSGDPQIPCISWRGGS